MAKRSRIAGLPTVVRRQDAASHTNAYTHDVMAAPNDQRPIVSDADLLVETIQELARQAARIADALEKMSSGGAQTLKPTYSVAEAAQLIGRSDATIRRWIREGMLESTKSADSRQGRHLIPRHSIERYLGSN